MLVRGIPVSCLACHKGKGRVSIRQAKNQRNLKNRIFRLVVSSPSSSFTPFRTARPRIGVQRPTTRQPPLSRGSIRQRIVARPSRKRSSWLTRRSAHGQDESAFEVVRRLVHDDDVRRLRRPVGEKQLADLPGARFVVAENLFGAGPETAHHRHQQPLHMRRRARSLRRDRRALAPADLLRHIEDLSFGDIHPFEQKPHERAFASAVRSRQGDPVPRSDF